MDSEIYIYLTADFRRLTQMRIRTFHRRDAEYAEEISFAQSGDDDWAKDYRPQSRDVFVCRRLPTNKKDRSLRLCGNVLKGISFCVRLRKSAVNSFLKKELDIHV